MHPRVATALAVLSRCDLAERRWREPVARLVQLAGEELGTGSNITSQDTAPFAVWVAARHLDCYEDALWTATAHPGLDLAANSLAIFAIDRDTVGAMVGGIVACATGTEGIPILWREATERLPPRQ